MLEPKLFLAHQLSHYYLGSGMLDIFFGRICVDYLSAKASLKSHTSTSAPSFLNNSKARKISEFNIPQGECRHFSIISSSSTFKTLISIFLSMND